MMELDGGRIGIASLGLGVGFAAIDFAIEYVKEREAFGKPLSSFEAIQWMIADSYTELEAAQLLVLRAAHLKEIHQPFTKEAWMAKTLPQETPSGISGDRCCSDVGRVWLYERLSCGTLPQGYYRNNSLRRNF